MGEGAGYLKMAIRTNVAEVIIGATRKEIEVVWPYDITGAVVFLQGWSEDVSATFNVEGVVADGPAGIARWVEVGGPFYVASDDLGAKKSARFRMRAKLIDAAGLVDYSPAFEMEWLRSEVDENVVRILGEVERTNFVQHVGDYPLPEIRRSSANPLLRQVVRSGMYVLTNDDHMNGVPATTRNEYLEVGETTPQSGQEMPGPFTLATYPMTASWTWDMENTSEGGIASIDAWAALQFGTARAAMPYPNAPAGPIAQLRWRPNPHSLVLYVARGDGVTPATSIALPVGASPVAGFRFRLVSVPGVAVAAYVNGVKWGEVTDPALLPDFSTLGVGAGNNDCRLGLSLWTGPGFGFSNPPGLTGWYGPISMTTTGDR